jgi:protein-disulfide isomerase
MDPYHPHLTKKERKQLRREQRIASEQLQIRRRSTRRFALWSSVLIGISAVVFLIAKLSTKPPEIRVAVTPSHIEVTPEDQVKGQAGSKVVLVEYSDFQCPACGAYYPILKRLYQEFGDRMRFVYRHFPLKQHLHAVLAARAAEAAGRQGKFWEMHDLIFEGQSTWTAQNDPEETFIGYARKLRLDIKQFRADLDSREVQNAIEKNEESGNQAGIEGTPTFFLNGVMIQNPRSYDEFKNLIQRTIQSGS